MTLDLLRTSYVAARSKSRNHVNFIIGSASSKYTTIHSKEEFILLRSAFEQSEIQTQDGNGIHRKIVTSKGMESVHYIEVQDTYTGIKYCIKLPRKRRGV